MGKIKIKQGQNPLYPRSPDIRRRVDNKNKNVEGFISLSLFVCS
jgi:hypothetical protein